MPGRLRQGERLTIKLIYQSTIQGGICYIVYNQQSRGDIAHRVIRKIGEDVDDMLKF